MKRRRLSFQLVLWVLLLSAAPFPAAGAARQTLGFVVCFPGGPDLRPEEQTVIRDFYAYLERKLELGAGALRGVYLNRREACARALRERSPGVLLLSSDTLLAHEKSLHLEPVAVMKVRGSTVGRHYLMTRVGGPGSLQELRGQALTGTTLGDPAFVARVLFEGKLGGPDEVVLSPSRLATRAIRAVIRARAAAVLLDEAQYRALPGSPWERKLRLIYTTPPTPNPVIAAARDRCPKGFPARLGKVLQEMTRDPEGRALVKTFGIDGFAPTSASAWDEARRRLGKER